MGRVRVAPLLVFYVVCFVLYILSSSSVLFLCCLDCPYLIQLKLTFVPFKQLILSRLTIIAVSRYKDNKERFKCLLRVK